MRNKWRKNAQKGFTLLEMLVVLFVISLLLLLFIPNIDTHRRKAEDEGNNALHQVLQTQVDLYIMEGNEKPTTFSQLGDDYLSQDQQKQAADNFEIVDGKVIKK